MPKYRNKGKRLAYFKSDIRTALVARQKFRILGKPIVEMDVSQLAFWALSAPFPHSRLGCLATLLEKLNHGHVVRGLLLSLDETEKIDNGEKGIIERPGSETCSTGRDERSGEAEGIPS